MAAAAQPDGVPLVFALVADDPEELEGAVGWSPRRLTIDRFGLNADFIAAHNLTWIDNLETGSGKNLADPRHKNFHHDYVQNYIKRFGVRKVEANALVVRPQAGRELCRTAIEKYLRLDGIHEYWSTLEAEQAKVADHVRYLIGAE